MNFGRLWLACLICVTQGISAASGADSPVHPVSPPGMRAYEVSLAVTATRLATAWHGGLSGRNALWLRFVDPDGNADGDARQMTDGRRDAYEADLQPFVDGLALAWYDKDPRTGALQAWLARLDAQGREVWRRALSVVGHEGRNPVVRVAGHGLLVAWIETDGGMPPQVWIGRFDRSGKPAGPARAMAEAARDTWNLNAAVDDAGTFYVVYDAALGARAKELQLLRVAPDGASERQRLSDEDGADSVYPDIAIAHGKVAIAWTDHRDGNDEVYLYVDSLRRVRAHHDSLDVDARARRITRSPGASTGASLAWNDRRLAVCWDEEEADTVAAYAAVFDASGRQQVAPHRLDSGVARALIPAIRPWRRGFALAWNDYVPDADDAHQPPRSSVAELRFLE